MPCFQSTQILLCDPAPPWPPLASCCSPLPIQDVGAGLQGHQWNCTHLPPNTGQTKRPSLSTSLYYISWLAGTAITVSKKILLCEVTTLLCSEASVVEWTHDQCQDSGITHNLPQKTQDSFLSEFTSTLHSLTLCCFSWVWKGLKVRDNALASCGHTLSHSELNTFKH